MTTLYLAWQDPRSRHWFPMGRLVRHETDPTEYEFSYVAGARQAEELSPFWKVPGFPELDRLYTAPEVFPPFRNRVMNLSRPDRPEYLSHLGIDLDDWDEVTELSVSGGRGPSDRFEMFPEIVPDEDGRFDARFVLHGLRHTNPDSIRRSESIEAGQRLELSFEMSNPPATHAISLKTRDQYILGWLPRYLVSWLHHDNAWMVTEAEATVAQMNPDAPLSHRLLVDFSGRLPDGFTQMKDLPEYQPIAAAKTPPAKRSIREVKLNLKRKIRF